MKKILFFLLALILIITETLSFAQKNTIRINVIDSTNSKKYALKTYPEKKIKTLTSLKNKFISKGYLLTELYEINETNYGICLGNKFSTLVIKNSNGKSDVIQPKEYAQFLKKKFLKFSNSGFPFYSIQLDSLLISDHSLSARALEIPGPYVKWTVLHVKTDSSISPRMLENLTGIKKGEYYQESKIINLTKRLSQFNYLEIIKPSEILFSSEGAELFTYLRFKKMSSLQGAIGLQPNPVSQRVGLTGELQLKLTNVLKRAELLDINWRSVQAGTSHLNARCAIPFLFQSSFGADGKLQLYKRDTTFLELKGNLAIQYTLPNGALLKGIYQLLNSNILGSTVNPLFPSNAKIQTHFFGAEFNIKSLDNLYNPRKGISFLGNVAVGNRFSETPTHKFYATVYKFQGEVESYQPIYKRHVLKFGIQAEHYYADSLYSNERIRTGGLNSIRGFNEEQIFATTKIISTLEYRFLVDQLSYAFLFADQGFMQDKTLNTNISFPLGVGVGFAYGTKLGTFALVGALGKFNQNSFDFRETKIHFGYTAYF